MALLINLHNKYTSLFFEGMKTYFIAGRVQDVDSLTNKTASYSDSLRDVMSSDTQMSRSQMSFRKVMTFIFFHEQRDI